MFDPKTATYKIEKTKYKGGKWINANTPVNTEGEPLYLPDQRQVKLPFGLV